MINRDPHEDDDYLIVTKEGGVEVRVVERASDGSLLIQLPELPDKTFYFHQPPTQSSS